MSLSFALEQDRAPRFAEFLRYVGWTERDAANVGTIVEAIERSAETIVERFYRHLDGFGEMSALLGDGARRRRLMETQTAYLLSLGRDMGSLAYLDERLAIGHAHESVGLATRWYIGAYAVLEPLIAEALARALGVETAAYRACLETVRKIIHIDSVLALEAYQDAAHARQDALMRDLETARRRLEDLVRHDALTGVAARREVETLLEAEHRRGLRFGHALSVLFVDIDHFKAINDAHGHAVGDDALCHVARTLAGALRSADVVGRWGGEEFVVGLVECEPDEAWTIAERMRRAVAASPLDLGAARVAITVSVGLACGPRRGEAATDLIARADRAMYEAKRAGRNRVVVDVAQGLTQVKDGLRPLLAG
jgi:diguanylate cyclase (GGDEF)-like protein